MGQRRTSNAGPYDEHVVVWVVHLNFEDAQQLLAAHSAFIFTPFYQNGPTFLFRNLRSHLTSAKIIYSCEMKKIMERRCGGLYNISNAAHDSLVLKRVVKSTHFVATFTPVQ